MELIGPHQPSDICRCVLAGKAVADALAPLEPAGGKILLDPQLDLDLPLFDKRLLRKRSLLETVNEQFKNLS